MDAESIRKIQGTFNYYITDEQAIFNAFEDEKTLTTALDIVNILYDTRTLNYPTSFIKVNEKCLSINMVLLDGVTANILANPIKVIDKKYDNLIIDKYLALDDNCSYKFVLYDSEKKKKPLLVFKLINPLLHQYNLIP